VGDLGAGQKQLTEIAKAISQDARVLILDEPSTALAVSDVERLFTFLRKLKAKGVAIIYVSHRMDEIARIADRATILRDGRHVITAPMADLPIDVMIEHIVGKRSKGLADVARGDVSRGEVLLELSRRHRPAQARQCELDPAPGRGAGAGGLARLWPVGAGAGDCRDRACGCGRDPHQGPERHDPPPVRRHRPRHGAGPRGPRDPRHHPGPQRGRQHGDGGDRPDLAAGHGGPGPRRALTDDMIARLSSRPPAATMRCPPCRAATSKRW
jgi:hypothetical protein